MVGPIFYQEMLLGARRGRWHWIRWIYAGWLVILITFWLTGYMAGVRMISRHAPNLSDLAEFAANYFIPYFTYQHFLLLSLIMPILCAGAITDEKSSGTLQYLLTADMFPGEILIGKLLARGYQAMLLALIGMPLICFLGVFGGMEPLKVVGFIFSTVLHLFTLGCISLLASVWCRNTREAVLRIYALGAIVLIGWQIALPYVTAPYMPAMVRELGHTLNPLLPIGMDWVTLPFTEYSMRVLLLTICWGGLGLACLLIAVWRLRPAYVRQMETSGAKRRLQWIHFRRPAVKDSPLTWKERYVEGIAPLAMLRQIPAWLGVIVVFVVTVVASLWVIREHLPMRTTLTDVWNHAARGDINTLLTIRQNIDPSIDYAFYMQGWAVILIVALIVGVRCSGAVTGEREKKSWEALLLTPIETHHLIRGKMWGIAGACVPYLIAYAIPAFFLSLYAGDGPFFWTMLWFGVTVLGVFYAGSTGIWCSVRSQTSWRSLLGTMTFIYGGGFILWCALAFLSMFVALFILLLIMLLESIIEQHTGTNLGIARGAAGYMYSWRIAMNILLAISFVLLSWWLLRNAEYRVSVLERTKHWKDEPRRPRRGRYRYEEEDYDEEDGHYKEDYRYRKDYRYEEDYY